MKELVQRLQPIFRFAERMHRELCRSRQRQVGVIAVLALIAAVIYALSVSQLHRQRDAFGDYVFVHVASADISAGKPMTSLVCKTRLPRVKALLFRQECVQFQLFLALPCLHFHPALLLTLLPTGKLLQHAELFCRHWKTTSELLLQYPNCWHQQLLALHH